MLVQALAKYADTYLAEELKAVAFEEKPVPYLVEIDESGHFHGIKPCIHKEARTAGKKVKTVEVVDTLRAPRSPVPRNNAKGIHPLLGCDYLSYVLGPGVWTDEGKEDKGARNHAGFIDLINKAAEATGDGALKACALFYSDTPAVERAAVELAALKPKAGSLACLAVRLSRADAEDPGGPVVRRPAVERFWEEHYSRRFNERHAEGGQGMCLISGEYGPLAVTHDPIKRTASLGGLANGVALMSFDKAAFRSYGWEKNANSPVSPERAAAYVLALNDLLKPNLHRQGWSKDTVLPTRSDYGGVAFLYWTRKKADEVYVPYVERPDSENVKRLLESMHHPAHRARGLEGGKDDNEFYLLAVSGNGGRLVVRDWFSESLERVAKKVWQWFEDLKMADVFQGGEAARPPSLYALLRAVSPPGCEPSDKANARAALALMRRALHGLPVGRSVLAAALNRLRREQGSGRLAADRVGLIRLCVNDIQKTRQGGPIMADCLKNQDQKDAAYRCGQLLAIYEALQYRALGEVNATVGDRYYAMASTRPLGHLSRAHLTRLRRDPLKRGAAMALHQRVAELTCAIGDFPASLSLEEQGRFVIGYHCQKADDIRRAREAKAAKQATGDAADSDN